LQRDPETAVEVVKLLMSVNPSMASQTMEANGAVMTPLKLACMYTNASNLSAGLEMIELLFDAYPEAVIGASDVARTMRHTENRFVDEVFNFLSAQRSYVEIAGNIQLVTTPDENGYLPLHIALHDQARLGAINLLVQADPPHCKLLPTTVILYFMRLVGSEIMM